MSTASSTENNLLKTRRRNLELAVGYHGHLCVGQVLGVHLSEAGMDAIKTTDPKKMIVYVENDRCIADTIQILTGTRLGRRSMKLANYGKMAATFINTETGNAYRVWVSGDLDMIAGDAGNDKHQRCERILRSPSEQVVSVKRVSVTIPAEELPGKPMRTVRCSACGEKVMDCKEVVVDGKPLCTACARGAYYRLCDDAADGARR